MEIGTKALLMLKLNSEKLSIYRIISNDSHFKSVIFSGPFKISTDHYHAVVDSALCACVYINRMDSPTDKRGWPILISKYLKYIFSISSGGINQMH